MPIGATQIAALTENIAAPLVKAFATVHFGEPIGTGAAAFTKHISAKLKNTWEERELTRRFEGLADKVVRSLIPLFESSEAATQAVEPISFQLKFALNHVAENFYLIRKNLDSVAIISDVKRKYPLPKAQHSDLEIQLYDRALERTVRCLIELAPLLPHFAVESVARQLQLLASIENKSDEVIVNIRRLEEMLSESVGKNLDTISEGQRFELEYRLSLSRELDYLELFGADIAVEAREHELSIAYITLNLATASDGNHRYISFGQLLRAASTKKSKRVLIRGEAGSGKSTLSRWAALNAARAQVDNRSSRLLSHIIPDFVSASKSKIALTSTAAQNYVSILLEQHLGLETVLLDRTNFSSIPVNYLQSVIALKDPGSDWQRSVPFLIRMRDCQNGLPEIEHFASHTTTAIGRPPSSWVKNILSGGRALVIFDGIDEIPNMNRTKVANQIRNLTKQYPDNIFVVTSRPSAVPSDWLASASFIEASINPLSESDKLTLIERWHNAIQKQLQSIRSEKVDLSTECLRLKQHIQENASLGRLAANPLLCAMICALHHSRAAVIPQSVAELCEALCHMLLERREAEAGIDLSLFPAAYRSLGYPQRKTLVQELAHYMVRNEASSLDVQTADVEIAKTYSQFPNVAPVAPAILRSVLVERAGVLREPLPGKIDFIHNTIKEYLAADQFVDIGDFGLLASHALEADWQPVLTFSASSNSKSAADKLIRALLERASKSNTIDRRRIHILAIQCVASAIRVSPDLKAEIDKIATGIFPPKTLAEGEQLSFGGDAVVANLKYRKNMPVRIAIASARALRLMKTARANAELERYLDDSRWSVISEVVQDINPLRSKVVRSIITGSAPQILPISYRTRINDLTPLGEEVAVKELFLAHVRVPTISPIQHLQSVRSLYLNSATVGSWRGLEKLTALKKLDVSDTAFSGKVLPASLVEFGAASTPLGSLKPLSECTELVRLNIEGSAISNFEELRNFSRIIDLEMGGPNVRSVSEVGRLPSLQRFVLRHSSVDDVSAIRNLKSLTTLYLSVERDVDLSSILELRQLELLTLWTPSAAHILASGRWDRLTVLNIDATQLREIAVLDRFPTLIHLSLIGLARGDLTAMPGLVDLLNLDLSRAKLASLTGIEKLLRLQELDLRDAEIDAPEGLRSLKPGTGVRLSRRQPRLIAYCKTLPNIRVQVL